MKGSHGNEEENEKRPKSQEIKDNESCPGHKQSWVEDEVSIR